MTMPYQRARCLRHARAFLEELAFGDPPPTPERARGLARALWHHWPTRPEMEEIIRSSRILNDGGEDAAPPAG